MTNPSLPPEILDCVIDPLHDEPETLKQCCLVSKSWVPRTRKHLFAGIKFRSADDFESWKKMFPDVANSPAYHTRALHVGCPWLVTAWDAEEDGWIRAFSGVASLDLDYCDRYIRAWEDSLAPFHKFSPSLKSLRVCRIIFPCPQVFDLIHSFPLLEDLTLEGCDVPRLHGGDPHRSQTVTPSTPPAFTGSLNFHILGGAGSVAHRLLDLPNGLHFRKLALTWDHEEDVSWITKLVMTCSHTLESLDITSMYHRTSIYIHPVHVNNQLCFQSGRGQPRSTSRKRRNSAT